MTEPIPFPGAIGPLPQTAIPSVSPVDGRGGAVSAGEASSGPDFKSILLSSLDEVNRLQREADSGVERLLTGQTQNVAEVMAAVNKAGIAFDLLMEVRNKLTDAYEEIKQMRV